MGTKRVLRPKLVTRTINTNQLSDLMDGRGRSFAEFFDEEPVWQSEVHRRETWERFRGQVYHTMAECQRLHKHPAAYYEYEDFDSAEWAHDKMYFHPDLRLSHSV